MKKRHMKIISRKLALAASIGLAALAGCGSTASTTASTTTATAASPPAPAASAKPADPVAILRQTGAAPDPGTVYGDHDVYGDRMASGKFPGGDSVSVYASPDRATYDQTDGLVQPDDQTGVVVIPGKLARIIINAYDGRGVQLARQVAARVHGQVVAP